MFIDEYVEYARSLPKAPATQAKHTQTAMYIYEFGN
jgi:hypothetical protein